MHEIYMYGQNFVTNLVVVQINMIIYFKNLIIELHILNVLKKHINFYVNWFLFFIRSIN